jgi:ADP-heptose:LPS heptosyltransferase
MHDPFAPGLLTRLAEPPRKIALLRASRVGDFICATPAFRALRAALPGAQITMITLPMLRDLAFRLPYFNSVADFPGYPGIAEQLFDARKTVQFIKEMQSERFDLAIQMQGTGVNSNPFMLLLGARMTAGFVRPGDGPGRLAAALPYPQQEHEIRTVLALTSFLGAPSQGEAIEFPLRAADLQEAAQWLSHVEPPFIGLHPAARDATRRWPLERFASVGAELHHRYDGTIILLGDGMDGIAADTIASMINAPCLNLSGKTSLAALGGIIARLALLVTNDTGPAHIAYALHTPTITIFGGGSPLLNGPLQPGLFRVLAHAVPCRPCGYTTCPIGYLCLQGVTVPQVVETAEAIIHT